MPCIHRLHADLGLVVLHSWGTLALVESQAALAAYFTDPLARPGDKHLIDTTCMTALEPNFAGLMQLQATIADDITPAMPETLLAILAPHPVGRELGRLIQKSWDHAPAVTVVIAETPADARAFLGLPETADLGLGQVPV